MNTRQSDSVDPEQIHTPSSGADLLAREIGRRISGDGLLYHERKGRIPSVRAANGTRLFKARDILALARRLREEAAANPVISAIERGLKRH